MKTIKEVETMLKGYLEHIREEIISHSGDKFADLQSRCKSANCKDVEVGNERYELQNWYGTISITDKALRAGDVFHVLNDAIEDMITDISTRMHDGTLLIDCNKMCLYELCDWAWLTGDNGEILHRTAGSPLYTATLVKYAVIAPRIQRKN